jgi:hypothetical protein
MVAQMRTENISLIARGGKKIGIANHYWHSSPYEEYG